METCIFLLECLESELRPLWHHLGSDMFYSCKRAIVKICKTCLSNISVGLLLEVRFVTGSAQRILDSFCLIYYAALGLSQTLDLDELMACLNNASLWDDIEEVNTQKRGHIYSIENQDYDWMDNYNSNMFTESNDGLVSKSIISENSIITTDPLYTSSKADFKTAAMKIYEGIAILFNLPLPPLSYDQNQVPDFMIEQLNNLSLVFPPPGINNETMELLNAMGFSVCIWKNNSNVHLCNWFSWFRITIRWHKYLIHFFI
jgi:hypothetical protein